MSYLHGVEMIELNSGSRPIRTSKSAVIGLVGTAPNSAPASSASLEIGNSVLDDGVSFVAVQAGVDGNAISIEYITPAEADSALTISVNGDAIRVNLATNSSSVIETTASDVVAAINADSAAKTLVLASLIGDGSGVVSASSKTYLSAGANEPFPLNKPVAVAGSKTQAAQLGNGGSLPGAIEDIYDQVGALVIVVRVAEGADSNEAQANVIAGMQGFLDSQSETGYKPRIFLATGFSEYEGVGTELQAKAARLKGVAYLDCAMTATYTDAVKRARNYGERVEITWPWVKVFDTDLAKEVNRPYSARAAGLRARIDAEKGFWWSKSNQVIYGITGLSQSVDWSLGDSECLANMLNENKVSTIINSGGFKHWGNRTCSSDPKWQFEQTRRTADIINDSIQTNHQWAVDMGITKTLFSDVTEGVNAYLRELKTLGAILGGECWVDSDLNSSATIQKGYTYYDFDFAPVYPNEHMVIRSRINNDYLEEVFA